VLPIPDPLLVELKVAKKRQASEKLTLGAAHADLGYVVCNEAAQPYDPDTLSKMLTPSLRPVCLGSACAARDMPAAARCISKAARPAVTAAWLGHGGVAFTMRTYVHSQPDVLADARAELGASCDDP
jgi:integrase